MSQAEKAKKLIIDFLSDGQVHTLKEMVELALKQSIVNEENTMMIGELVCNMQKEEERLITVGEEKYKWREFVEAENDNSFEVAIELIMKRMDELACFDWKHCMDDELLVARQQIKVLKQLSVRILNVFYND